MWPDHVAMWYFLQVISGYRHLWESERSGMVTVKDVAARAGVSMITVSRVVNGSSLVGAETRAKVEVAIRELNYIPNAVASNLRSRQSDLIGLVLPDITTTFWTTIARGVEDEAWSRGYSVFICNTDDDPDKEQAYVDKLLQRRVEGLIVAPSKRDNTRDLLNRVKLQQANFVVIHRSPDGIEANTVRTDGYQATRRLTEALIDRGSRRIAYLGMSLDDPLSTDRLKGFREVMAEREIPIDEDLVVADPFRRDPGTYGIAFELITRDPRPDAIVLGNSSVAVHALHAIQDAGLAIPRDIAVATFHDITSLDFYAPYLIRAVQPSYLMGRTAMQKLFEIGKHPAMPVEEIVLMPEIHLPAGKES